MNGSSAGGDIMFLNFHVTSPEHRFTGLYGVVVITITQVYKTKPELSLCAGLNPASGVSEIGDGKNLWQWSRLEKRLNAFRRSIIYKNFLSSSYLNLWVGVIASHHLTMFGGQWSHAMGDKAYLICHVTSENFVIETALSLMSWSSS